MMTNEPTITTADPDTIKHDGPLPTLADGSPDDDAQNNLVVRGKDGDPLADPKSVAMIEYESYERVVEGLKIAADAAKHLARREPNRKSMWIVMAGKLDQVRRIAVQHAGIGLVLKEKETGDVRGNGLELIDARMRFRNGLKQAEGGCRQLGVAHRGELIWAKMSYQLRDLADKVRAQPTGAASYEQRDARPRLILPN
jgi:hypothetical protein